MIDQDEIDDLRAEARAVKHIRRCQCDGEPGMHCPGPEACPNSGDDDGEEE